MPIDMNKIMEAVNDPTRLAEVSRELAQSGPAPQVDQLKQLAGEAAKAEITQSMGQQAPGQAQVPAPGQAPGASAQPNGANALIDPNIAIQQQGTQGFNPSIIPQAPSNPAPDLGTLIRGS